MTSSTTIHTEHKYDVTFQHLVAKATLPVNKTYLVRVNSDYRRDGEIDLNQLFVVEDMAEHIAKNEDEVYQSRVDAFGTLRLEKPPLDEHCYNPNTCPYPGVCFPALPDFSIYDLGRGSKKQYQALIDIDVELVKDIPDTFKANYKQRLQIQSARTEKPIQGNLASHINPFKVIRRVCQNFSIAAEHVGLEPVCPIATYTFQR